MANFRPPTHPLVSTWLLNAPYRSLIKRKRAFSPQEIKSFFDDGISQGASFTEDCAPSASLRFNKEQLLEFYVKFSNFYHTISGFFQKFVKNGKN